MSDNPFVKYVQDQLVGDVWRELTTRPKVTIPIFLVATIFGFFIGHSYIEHRVDALQSQLQILSAANTNLERNRNESLSIQQFTIENLDKQLSYCESRNSQITKLSSTKVTAATNPQKAPLVEKPFRLSWPVRGVVLSKYGSKTEDGGSNDGINIKAPEGLPVHASADGIVLYAGNALEGFGNLLIVRHNNGYVTAYAHLQQIKVEKEDVLTMGQTVGTVGETGKVVSAQLHFELRKNGKPVDPLQFLSEIQ